VSKPILLIVRDGWGIGDENDPGNAVARANTPNMDSLLAKHPKTRLGCSGEDVGLTEGSQGSSEVGHLNMGAGRIVDQEIIRINKRLSDGTFFTDPKLQEIAENCKKNDSALHLMGLVQDQGVHATEEHLYALLDFAKQQNLGKVYIHFFSDGRDTPPRSALKYLERLENKIKEFGVGQVASVMGRFYAMDRDRNWERIELAYRALTQGDGLHVKSARQAIEEAYSRADEAIKSGGKNSGIVENDEFIKPSLVVDSDNNPIGKIKSGDSVIFFNYRQDRAIQITMAFMEKEFDFFKREICPDIVYLGLTRYYDLFENYIIPPMDMSKILGEVLCENNLRQLRIAETQKFRHVTSFFNSKLEKPFCGEDRILVDSPKVPEVEKPEMSAYEVTDAILVAITDGIEAARNYANTTNQIALFLSDSDVTGNDDLKDTYDVIVLNFVNGDMVGHTGSLEAATKAIECVDECLGKVIQVVLDRDGIAMVTADHGNAEQMINPETGNPHTAHTLNDVDFVFVTNHSEGIKLPERGILSDIAPTILELLEIQQPPEMTAKSLLQI
jgi:2,3-bisphosphoglycerate-independent phosphoglycerate mutase